MTSQYSSGRGKGRGHDTSAPPPPPQTPPQRSLPPGPKLQVQRSLSRDTITIHFSALGKEEEEEELYGAAVASAGAGGPSEGQEDSPPEEAVGIATALEASEELLFDPGSPDTTFISAAAELPASQPPPVAPRKHSHTQAVSIVPASPHPAPPASSSWPSEKPPVLPQASASGSSSPSRSAAGLSSSKPFLSLVRSLSNDVESKDAPSPQPPPPGRHRHLMKSFVKSLSTDTSKPDPQDGSHPQHPAQTAPHQRLPESRRNMQLFKQFSQPRLCTTTPPVTSRAGGDSKTAPSSPLPSPDGRSFFKVQEVEARIEDTKRRLSEVMCEPLQLLSKIMGDEGGTASAGGAVTFTTPHRSKSLSSSASELSAAPAVNGHIESNNNYSIKEEEGGELEEETPAGRAPDMVFFSFPAPASAPGQTSSPPRSPSLGLGRCTMSALVARQEEEDFCELYSEDFELCTDTETPEGERPESRQPHTGSTGVCSEAESEEEEELAGVPMTALVFLTQLVYLYLVLPVPPYVCAVVQGVAAGFLLAILVLWWSAPGGTSHRLRKLRRRGGQWNLAQLDIQEPGVFKGWMNEIQSYDPETYHATLTHSVYVRLEGSTLRLSRPHRNIARRAAHNEPKPDVTFISQKIYDLADSKIHLVPQSLARKRVWNKKYPICIQLAKQDDFLAKAQGERPEPGEERGAAGGERLEGAGGGEDTRRLQGGELTLYLFGRTGREKEEWFRRILMASRSRLEGRSGSLPGAKSAFPHSGSRSGSGQSGGAGGGGTAGGGGGAAGGGGLGSQSRSSSRGSLMEELPPPQPHPSWGSVAGGVHQKMLLDYSIYMAKYVSSTPPLDSPAAPASPPALSPSTSPTTTAKLPRTLGEASEPEAWVNALLGRIFWDFLGEKYWADVVSKKIQMKLSKIRLPYFMNELTLTELDMGVALPKIHQASRPWVDHQGLWFDLEVSYSGSFLMTLETKMNLARLGKEGEGLGEQGKEGIRPRAYCLADSDEESSSAGSSDEEDPPELVTDKPTMPGAEGYVGGHRPSKIMRFVDKIAKSKYFQKATETEFIKKRMEEVSNTPLLLTVEVQECRGTLAVNIPPPPTDRIWYGFRNPPHLELKARPKLGEREVTLAHVTDWIEKKLDQEFQKIFVMPNMDDVWLPIMHSAMDTRSNTYMGSVPLEALGDTDTEQSEAEVSTM